MKRILTILLMTVAFAMNVSVVNAKISTGQGGTGKEFMMAMMADGDPKSTATINGDSKTWEYGTFQLYSWDSGANITFVLANGNCSYLINGDSEPGNTYKSNSFAGNADKEIIVTVTEMGVINNIYGQYRFVFEKDANQNYVCNYYGEYTGGGGSDDPTPTAPAAPTISCSNNTITIEAESGAGIKYIYSTDGNDPSGDFTTTTNNTVTISITSGQIVKVKAYATKNNLESTQVTGGPFNYVEPASKPAAPSISINHGFEVNAADGGGYTISNTLTFTESTSGANIYYTTDGTDPKSSGTRQTVSNNGQVVIGLDNNYSNVIKIRAVAELSGTYSDETTMDKAYTPELSTNGTTLSITQTDYSTYIFYHGDGETTWTCMKSGRTIDNYANIAPVSVVAATAEKLLSNIAVQNGGGTLPTSGDWDYGSWNTSSPGSLQINSIQKLLRYTVSNTRGQNEPTASSGTGIDNSYTFNFPLSSLSSDGTYYLQILTGDYNSTPIGVYTWKVTKSGSSYTYEYLGKNEDTQPTAKPTITFDANTGKVTAMSADDVDASHIYYTTDGNDPTTSSNTWANAQSNGVVLSSNATIKVMAQADGKSASQVVSFTNSNLPTINCNDNAITYSNTEGYTLMYCTDGNHYNTNEITSISQNTTIYLKATNSNGVTVLTSKECTVVPTKDPGITCSGNTINISAVSGAVIKYRYSTDGSTPSGEYSTSSGNTQAITVGAGQTVKVEAYATKYGVLSNTVTGGPYRYVPTAPTISEGVDGGHSGQGTSSPYIYLRITNYTTVKPTDAYHVEYSFDGGQTYNTLTQSDGYIYIPASNFDGQDADISVYAKTVYVNDNERFESAVVEKKLHKTVGLTVAYNSGKITITAATTGWDEIMFSTDGGHNWFIHNFNDGNIFDVYPTTQDAPSYDGESPLYVRARAFKNGTFDNEALYMYSDEACYIGKPTIQDLAYTQVNSGDNTGLFNYFEIHSIEGLKVRYTTDGTDPTNSPTAKEYNMPGRISDSEIYEAEYDQLLSSSLDIADEGMTLQVVATDGKGHFSDVYTSKLYQKSDMPIFTDFGSYIELSVENPSGTPHNTIYYKTDSGNWPNAGSATPPYFYKKDFTTIQASALWNAWTKLYSDMLIVEVTTPTPTLSYDEDANQVTISCEEGKDLMYSINGDKSFIKASGQSITLDVPQGGLSVQAYSTSTAENTPETNMTTIYTSNVSTGNYTYTNTDPSITVSANWEGGADGTTYSTLSNIFTITAPGYEGGTIYYTTDGTDPTTSSSVYDPENKPQLVVGDDYALTSSYTIKVLAVADGKEYLTFSQTFEKTANTAITIVEGTQGDDFAKVSINNDNGFVWKQIGTPTETHDELWHKNTANPQDNIAYGNELYARTIEDGKLISNLVVRPVNDERFKFGPYIQTVFPSPEGSLVFYEEGDDNDELWETEGALYQGIAQTGLTFVQIVKAEYSFDGGTTYTTAQVVKPEDGSNIFIIPAEELIGKSSLTVKVLLETGEEVTSTITNEKVTKPVVEVITNGGENHNETGLQVSRPEDANTTECYILLSNDGGETWFIPTNEDGDGYCTLDGEFDTQRFIPTSVVFGENVETPDWSQVQVRVNEKDEHLLSDPVGVTIGSGWPEDWEPYGRGTWTDAFFADAPTFDVYVRTNLNDTNKKQIKVVSWITGYNNPGALIETRKYTGYEDFIFNWNTETNECSISEDDEPKFLGIVDVMSKSDTDYKWIIPAANEDLQDVLPEDQKGQTNGKYDPKTDTFTLNYYYWNSTAKSPKNPEEDPGTFNDEFNLQKGGATLKMEGMWLGDLDDKNNGIQNSYMPQLSQYKIGLVKIPTATNYTNKYLEFDSKGVCRIVLDEGDFNDFFNTTNDNLIILTERHWIDSADEKGEGTLQPLLENSTDTYKMLQQFTIRDEGAYYIVVARLVPSYDNEGNKIYEYTGAYQYMPVYYSPKGNWVTLNDRHYKEDIVGGLYTSYRYSEYDVEVQENINDPGIYRVKNMYGENYQGNTKELDDEEENYVDKERFSYQGESPYRQNVYFYIDARDTTEVKLLNNMFYAQPLGVDWGYGEMMLVDLGTGVFESGHIKFISDDKNGNPIGTMYEWEDYDGYEYDGDPGTCISTNDAGHDYGTQGNAPGTTDDRFDLYIDDYTDWTEFELYGRGAWGQSDSKKYNYKKENTTDIYISTNKKNPNLKRIKIMGWGPSNDAEFAGFDKDENYTCDLVFDWNMENNTCYVSNPQYTGFSSGDKKLWTITSLASEKYDTTVDSYEFRLDYSSNISGNNSRSFTLKMDGLWLGDMTEEGNTATQEAFMPQNSHYKIGLVKIDGKELAEDGKYYIELEDASAVETFFDTNANTNFVDGTVKERHLNDGYNYTPLETGNENETVMKMKEEFDFDADDDDDEGAYYIVAARLVPGLVDENGIKHYDYSGAYRYMPVYYSPSRNWQTLSYDGMRTYRDDLAYGYGWYELEEVYNKEIEEAPVYSVEVQEKKDNPGLFRVKNMYHSGFLGVDDSEFTSYQGESSYRDGVYFYIDATDPNDVKLYPSEFYAQPLGIDLLNGEYMMTSLNGGKYIDGQIIFEDEGYIFEYDNIFEFFNYWQSGNIVKNNGLIKMDSSVNWHDGEQFQLQISTPYPLFDDTPYTTTDMNPKWPDEYEDNSEDYNEKYGEVWAMFDEESDYYEDYHEEWYTDGITKGQDHVDVTYERNITNCYGTIMMPFSFKASDLKLESNADNFEDAGFSLYKLTKQSGNTLTFTNINSTDEEDNAVDANHPVVFKYNKADIPTGTNSNDETVTAKIVIDIKDTEVVGEIDPDTEEYSDAYTTEGVIIENFDNWQTIGAYTPLGVESQFEQGSKFSANGIYWYVTKYGLDKSYAFTGNAINTSTKFVRTKQYRAFFYNESASSSAKSFMVVYDDNPIFTDIDSVVDGRSKRTGSYNVAGQKVNRNYRGVVIENGKKSIRIKR